MTELALQERINLLPQTDDNLQPHVLVARKKYPRSFLPWSNEEDNILIALYQNGKTNNSIAHTLKRSNQAIDARVKMLNLDQSPTNIIQLDKTNLTSNKEALNVLHYWRTALADSEKMGLEVSKMKEGLLFTTEAFKTGQLPVHKIKKIFLDAEKYILQNNKNESKHDPDVEIKKLQVIIAPYTLVKNTEHGEKILYDKSPAEVLPLWLVADLTREGQLIPCSEQMHPWIDRKCLTPNENGLFYPILGEIEQLDDFYTKNNHLLAKEPLDWKTLFNWAETLFSVVVEEKENILLKLNYKLFNQGYLLSANEKFSAAKPIIVTYDQYIFSKDKPLPRLLEQFCLLDDREHQRDLPLENLYRASLNHLGQMQNKYSLSISQRMSLSYFNEAQDNDIFTINGPPGTGKTNLLLSVIASQWVTAALDKKMPPIIVAASTNNLAVTNILDNLSQNFQSDEKEAIRWLPNFNYFGLYLASAKAEKEAKNKNYAYRLQKNKFCSLDPFYDKDYQQQATSYFLEQFNLFFNQSESNLSNCQRYIHEQMLAKRELLNQAIDFVEVFFKFQNTKGSMQRIKELVTINESDLKNGQSQLKQFQNLQINWLTYKTSKLFWWRLFSWIKPIKAILQEKIKLFFLKYADLISNNTDDLNTIDQILQNEINAIYARIKSTETNLSYLNTTLQQHTTLLSNQAILEERLHFPLAIENLYEFSDKTNILNQLDLTIRYQLFILAAHYWEAGWLLENKKLSTLPFDVAGRKLYWQIQAMLTPCLITTLHTGPGYFQYKNAAQKFETLTEFIDLLIIDEAGQILPAIAGALIASAKKVLLVGDAKQIEPIALIPEEIDFANSKKLKLCTTYADFNQLKLKGILCSSDSLTNQAYGNLITIGQRKAQFHLQNNVLAGMMLREHRRCPKEIIAYSNELCYDNQLIPLTNEKPCIYPRMGYAHIKGYVHKNGGSICNQMEAEAIAAWVAKNKNALLQTCGEKDLGDCITIITPFAAQRNLLYSELKKYQLHSVEAGTIHSLQGAEKPIIIFSPVYTAEDKKKALFFDKSPNMLNVAVSRAKMSFLVFGDIDIFVPGKNDLPSSVLAKYLFAKEENEIVDVIQPKYSLVNENDIEQINTLARHREVLINSFNQAETELNIVSPFLRVNAIESDNIAELIAEHANRIKITIYTDPQLNNFAHVQDNFAKAIAMLEAANAHVVLVKSVHSKIITIDDKIIVEGSFNWLSAVRYQSDYQRVENSILYSGELVARFIKEAIEPIRDKMIVQL